MLPPKEGEVARVGFCFLLSVPPLRAVRVYPDEKETNDSAQRREKDGVWAPSARSGPSWGPGDSHGLAVSPPQGGFVGAVVRGTDTPTLHSHHLLLITVSCREPRGNTFSLTGDFKNRSRFVPDCLLHERASEHALLPAPLREAEPARCLGLRGAAR